MKILILSIFSIPLLLFAGDKKLEKPVLIDVRPEQAYQQGHIPGSINLNLRVLKHLKHLKRKNLKLVGHFWQECILQNKARELKQAGFNQVEVLTGGIELWKMSQKKVVSAEKLPLAAFIELKRCRKINVDRYSSFDLAGFKQQSYLKLPVSSKKISVYILSGKLKNVKEVQSKLKEKRYFYFINQKHKYNRTGLKSGDSCCN